MPYLNTKITKAIIKGIPIMSKPPIVADQGQKPSEVYQMMNDNRHIHHIPIVNGSHLVGIVSSTDFLRAMYSSTTAIVDIAYLDREYSTITKMMLQNRHTITTIKNTESVHNVAEKLMNGDFHSLPVVDENENIVGIVTSTDLVKYLSNIRSCKEIHNP